MRKRLKRDQQIGTTKKFRLSGEYSSLTFFRKSRPLYRVAEPLRVWTFFYFLARKKFNPL
ncbi:hypothetical protein LEP1GSC193_0595 [Leptospira alstonii serovar Pingchang str. 80-412]|uniref:Uncharacterized protein n=2 Tax=Leptospira alstonii TaxID=28452 RepID=M6CY91_9LEPT|nr:hypothetical protein LEP1GSC194_2049 [Leptospira alstonii serovar Sichuan str. 79601]EQA80027.1 hypothetical protein LEP1GSC193_0595 [Leptospira alstonii serovar Pingchang str. 80-412]